MGEKGVALPHEFPYNSIIISVGTLFFYSTFDLYFMYLYFVEELALYHG